MPKMTFKSFVLAAMLLSSSLPTLATYAMETEPLVAQKRSVQAENKLQ